jgi:hypothetical protein
MDDGSAMDDHDRQAVPDDARVRDRFERRLEALRTEFSQRLQTTSPNKSPHKVYAGVLVSLKDHIDCEHDHILLADAVARAAPRLPTASLLAIERVLRHHTTITDIEEQYEDRSRTMRRVSATFERDHVSVTIQSCACANLVPQSATSPVMNKVLSSYVVTQELWVDKCLVFRGPYSWTDKRHDDPEEKCAAFQMLGNLLHVSPLEAFCICALVSLNPGKGPLTFAQTVFTAKWAALARRLMRVSR